MQSEAMEKCFIRLKCLAESSSPSIFVKVSVLIPVLNQLELTQSCLQSLMVTLRDVKFEIILVDDVSDEPVRKFLSQLSGPIKVILNDTRQGFATNMNRAAQEASGDMLCLLNNDTYLLPGWFAPVAQALSHAADPGFIGNVQWSPRTGRYDHMGVILNEDLNPDHYGRQWRWKGFSNVREFPFVTAACCFIRRSVYAEVGGFDTAYRNGFEDMDMCLRLAERGYHHYVAGGSVIHHWVSSTEGRKDHENANLKLFRSRWLPKLEKMIENPALRRLRAWNYIMRHVDRPWRYNGPRLLKNIQKSIMG